MHYVDTYTMHYNAFVYMGKWLRGVFFDHSINIWEPAIGYGSDFFLTFFSWDPLDLISVFVKEECAETAFTVMLIVRVYLTGLSFLYYALRKGAEPYAALCGAIVFAFSSCVYLGLYQAMFLIPMYIFPLMLSGADDIFDNNRDILYILSLTLLAILNFYLVYMSMIMLFIYCLIKWILRSGRTVRGLVHLLIRFIVDSLFAAGIAAFQLVPRAIIMSSMGRLNLERNVPVLYSKEFYDGMWQGFTATFDMMNRDCNIGFSVLVLLCLIALFTVKDKNLRQLKIEAVLMTVGLCIPAVGSVMNGFAYPANRFIWAYAILLSLAVTVMIPKLRSFSRNQKFILLGGTVIYFVAGYTVFNKYIIHFPIVAVMLILIAVAVFFADKISYERYKIIAVILSCITVIVPAFFQYSKGFTNFFTSNIDAGMAYYTSVLTGGMPTLKNINNDDATRYNHSPELYHVPNSSMLSGISGQDFYCNMYNEAIYDFHDSIALNSEPSNFSYDGLDGRSELMALTGVKHYIVSENDIRLPVGYDVEEVRSDKGGYISYTPSSSITLFTLFDKSVPEDEYMLLTPFERQQMLMHACVVDGDATSHISDLEVSGGNILYSSEDSTIQTAEADESIVISFEPQEDKVIYVSIEDLTFDDDDYYFFNIEVEALSNNEAVNESPEKMKGFTKTCHLYGGKDDWLVNLGLIREGVDSVRISFEQPGSYHYGSIRIYSEDPVAVLSNINGLDHSVDGHWDGMNSYYAEVENDSPRILFAAIPYSQGWKAFDNGKEIDIIKADVGFMALRLDPGTHYIEFAYTTPGSDAGRIISLISVIGCIVYLRIMDTRKNKKKQEK